MADREFKIDVYQAVVMVERAWREGITPQTIQNSWIHTCVFSGLIDSEREEARHFTEISEVANLLVQLTLLSSKIEKTKSWMLRSSSILNLS